MSAVLFGLSLLFFLPSPLYADADEPPLSRQDQDWRNAETLYRRKRWAPAETAYAEYRRDHGVHERALEALYRIGVCRQQRRDASGAMAAWREVSQLPANRPAERDALRRALAALFETLDPYRNRHDRRVILSRLAREFPDSETTIRLHIAEGRHCLQSARIADAIRLFGAVEDHIEGFDRDLLEVARAHAGRGHLSASMIMQLADNRLESQEYRAAVPLYELALRAAPTQAEEIELRTKYGWSQYIDGNLADAEDQWRRVLDRTPAGDPWRGRSRWHLAVLHAGHKQDLDTAIALCAEQAQEFRGHFMGEQALFSHAWLLMVDEQWEPALDSFRQLVAAYPRSADNPHVQNYIAQCEQNLEKRQ